MTAVPTWATYGMTSVRSTGNSVKPPSVRFERDMRCCRPSREAVGLDCARPQQLCCAWAYVERIAREKGFVSLKAFAVHLLAFWPLSDVFFAFAAGRQMSALAAVCADRWQQMPDSASRDAYRAELVSAARVYRAECGPDNPAAFVATFHVLCEAAMRP